MRQSTGKFFLSRIQVASYLISKYGKTCLKRNLKGPEHFSAKARFPFNQGTLPVYKLTQDMHVFETKHHTQCIHSTISEHTQTLHCTEEKIKVLAFSLFFPMVKEGVPHAVYSLGCLTFHKHFSLRNYTKHV